MKAQGQANAHRSAGDQRYLRRDAKDRITESDDQKVSVKIGGALPGYGQGGSG